MRGLTLHVAACVLAAAAPFLHRSSAPSADLSGFPGWPAAIDGRPLSPLPPTDLDRRFAADLAGCVARFTDGEREIVLRWAPAASRDVHPASVCFVAAGWDVAPLPVEVGADGGTWSRFRAVRGGTALIVRERVRDAAGGSAGRSWGDVTSWYWASLLGRAPGAAWIETIAARERR